MSIYSIITGTGSYLPEKIVKNEDFLSNEFYERNGERIFTPTTQIIEKFKEITTIETRRHATDDINTSDMAKIAAERAIEASGIDREELDYIIVAHNFGEPHVENRRISILPILSVLLKQKLGIHNPGTVAYDILFGCPGWIQALIQANYYIKSGDAKKVLVVGADILSRVSDPHDRDSMIYADGAAAVILEGVESEIPVGIIGHNTRSDSLEYSQMLRLDYSYKQEEAEKKEFYLKMNGRKLYQYALEFVPQAIKAGLDKLNLHINDVHKVLIHQANGKMDDAIIKRLFKLYDIKDVPEDIMPMTISWLGNSSVATVPTLIDLLMNGKFDSQTAAKDDILVFASVGAGMSINSVVYKMP
ncbi:MAG: 3-oxoacyl-ACP synthase III family protein [Paludibacteraceae bacterium]